MHLDWNYVLEFGRSLLQFGIDHKTETITWLLVAMAGGRFSYVAVARFVGRNQARVMAIVAQVVQLVKEAAADLATIPHTDPLRQLTDLHQLLLRSSEATSRSIWGKLGALPGKLIPGSRSRRANKRFDNGLSALLAKWKDAPNSTRADLAREVVEAVIGPIDDYINDGASDAQVLSAASKRYEVTSRGRRTAAPRVASALAVIAKHASFMTGRAKSIKADRDAALTAISNRATLDDLLKLAKVAPQLVGLCKLLDAGVSVDDIGRLIKAAPQLTKLVEGGAAKGLARLEQLAGSKVV